MGPVGAWVEQAFLQACAKAAEEIGFSRCGTGFNLKGSQSFFKIYEAAHIPHLDSV